jgi:hypothetical protein
LLFNGGLDINTPMPGARELAAKYGATLAEFPFAGHVVASSMLSPLGQFDPSCNTGIERAFLAEPNAKIDTSCAATATALDVAGHAAVALELVAQLYGSDTPLLGATD